MMKADGLIHSALKIKPTLRDDCFGYYETYRLLSVGRIYSQVGPQPISLGDITTILNELHITSVDDRMRFIRHMRLMDSAELTYRAENPPKPKPK